MQSRQQQAFRALLESSDDEDTPSRKKSNKRSSSNKKATSSSKKSSTANNRIPGFKLREEQPPHPETSNTTTSGQNQELEQLHQMFQSSLPLDIIQDVYRSCGSFDAALDALLSMGATTSDDIPSTSSTRSSQQLDSSSNKNTTTTDNNTPNMENNTTNTVSSLWDVLPLECKDMILTQLSTKDLALSAGTCREFAAYVRATRQSTRSVVIPAGISLHSITGLIQAYTAATMVDLTRYLRPKLDAVDLEYSIDGALAAIASGERARKSSLPVYIRKIVVKNLSVAGDGKNNAGGRVADALIESVCTHLRHLEEVVLDGCWDIEDRHLRMLASYQRDCEAKIDDFEKTVVVAAEKKEEESLKREFEGLAVGSGSNSSNRGVETPAEAVARIVSARNSSLANTAKNLPIERTPSNASSTNDERGLQGLYLAGTGITTSGVRDILRGQGCMRSLLSLDVSRCRSVTDFFQPGPKSNIRWLKATKCPGIRNITLQLPSNCPLEVVSFADCANLVEFGLLSGSNSITEINVSGCSKLDTVSLRCPKLKVFKAAKCASLEFGFGSAVFDCPRLQEVNFSGCQSLTAEAVVAISPSLYKVQIADFSGCRGLTRLIWPHDENQQGGNSSSNLECLTVTGCSELERVLVGSPKMQTFIAKGCSKLTEVKLTNENDVRVLDLENCSRLSDIVVGDGSGGNVAVAGATTMLKSDELSKEGVKGRRLNLRGCDMLSMSTKSNLKSVVLRSVS